MPHLRFHYDQSVVNGSRMSALIDEAIRDDQSKSGNEDE
jgi:ribosome-binding factor A